MSADMPDPHADAEASVGADRAMWLQRWREQRIGFHQSRVSPLLEQHWDALGATSDARVFVPLCGKTLDMAWLAARGHRVLGVELAEAAVRQFFDEQRLEPVVQASALGMHFTSGPYELIVGDAFALDPATLADCGAAFDRGALIALPPDLRRTYAATAYARLPPGCRALAITLEYPQTEKIGPPFSVAEPEVRALFEGDWSVDVLERRDILDREPGFVADGVTALATVAYAMTKVSAAG